MTFLADIDPQLLSEPPATSAVGAAAIWTEALLTGTLATSLAVVAIAALGFMMLSGRLEIRRAVSVLLGIFVLLGARSMPQGLRGIESGAPGAMPSRLGTPINTLLPVPNSRQQSDAGFDPYAGASVPAH